MYKQMPWTLDVLTDVQSGQNSIEWKGQKYFIQFEREVREMVAKNIEKKKVDEKITKNLLHTYFSLFFPFIFMGL